MNPQKPDGTKEHPYIMDPLLVKNMVVFEYTNYRGETKWRYVIPSGKMEYTTYQKVCPQIKFTSAEKEFLEKEQWFIVAHDLDKQADRHFAVERINKWRAANSYEIAVWTAKTPAAIMSKTEPDGAN